MYVLALLESLVSQSVLCREVISNVSFIQSGLQWRFHCTTHIHMCTCCSCWEVLMDMEDVECCRNTSKWWFHVHQTLAKLQEGQNGR